MEPSSGVEPEHCDLEDRGPTVGARAPGELGGNRTLVRRVAADVPDHRTSSSSGAVEGSRTLISSVAHSVPHRRNDRDQLSAISYQLFRSEQRESDPHCWFGRPASCLRIMLAAPPDGDGKWSRRRESNPLFDCLPCSGSSTGTSTALHDGGRGGNCTLIACLQDRSSPVELQAHGESVDSRGVEPLTSCLPDRRSPS